MIGMWLTDCMHACFLFLSSRICVQAPRHTLVWRESEMTWANRCPNQNLESEWVVKRWGPMAWLAVWTRLLLLYYSWLKRCSMRMRAKLWRTRSTHVNVRALKALFFTLLQLQASQLAAKVNLAIDIDHVDIESHGACWQRPGNY